MYSRSTERRGRTNLPPGYDGSAFRHDTGERRSFDYPTEMKIHDAGLGEEEGLPKRGFVAPSSEPVPEKEPQQVPKPGPEPQAAVSTSAWAEPAATPHSSTFLSGMLENLGQEEWLLLFLILLLLADGSDAWEVILLLCVLLAVR